MVLGVLIFFHELGHFLAAKYFGVKVLKFSLGFGPKLVGKKVGETEYLISALPLGGYVKMLGENTDEEDEPLSPEDKEKSFSNKHALQRIAIVAAGPIFNLILALLIFWLVNKPSVADFMISAEGELKKVSWSSRREIAVSTLIVIIVVVVMAILLFSTDMFFQGGTQWALRFTGTRVGRWTFSTSSADPELNGHTGKLTIHANATQKAHGFLQGFGTQWGWQNHVV